MASERRFKIIPDADELATIERDLRFFPAGNDSPRVLTKEQIADYNRDGYLRGIRIFDEAEAADIRRTFDALLEKTLAAGRDSYSISTAHLTYPWIRDILLEPRIIAHVRDLLGNDVIAWGSHFFCKMPGDGKAAAWHQDASYWPLTPSKTVTVWLAVDDAERENACMQFIPGSHLHGHLQYTRSDPAENNVLDQTVEDAERFGEPVDVELRAGEISLHSDLLLHGSPANRSSRRRSGLTLRYSAADVRAYLGWSAKGIVASGSDPTGLWGQKN
ncbi:MAG: phytanoyl-CoA dioxygenase family protein [Planctomycetota bacterium]|nr:phytanoyl-CoA dioxygenase family protein [Planctomycetota bacterium]